MYGNETDVSLYDTVIALLFLSTTKFTVKSPDGKSFESNAPFVYLPVSSYTFIPAEPVQPVQAYKPFALN